MSSRCRFYLIEDFDPSASYADGTIISLSPQVSYELTDRKIPYQIPESFYSEAELRRGEDDFFFRQIAWFDRFDEFLKNEIGYCHENNLAVGRIYLNRFKYFLDSVILQALILRSILTVIATKNGEVVFVHRRKPETRLTAGDSQPYDALTYFWELLPQLAKELNIPYSEKLWGETPLTITVQTSEKPAIQEMLRKMIQWIKLNKWNAGSSETPFKIFFVHAGSKHLDPVMRDLRAEGVKIYYRGLVKLDDTSTVTETLHQDCKAAAARFKTAGKELMDWVSKESRMDVNHVIQHYFESFLNSVLPDMLTGCENLRKFFARENMDYVLTHTISDSYSKSSVLAARITGAQTACIQHGCDVYSDRVWEMTDLDAFDIYFATDGLSQERFSKAARQEHISACEVYQSPHYLKSFAAAASRGKKKVLYVPTKLALHYRNFNCLIYPATWFFEYQKDLVKFFASQKDFEFIYKQSGRRIDEAILPFIEKLNAPNIRVVSGTTAEHFKDADMVLLDRPTTAFFEAVQTGLPTLCLYPEFIQSMVHRPSAEHFGKSLRSFTDAADACEKVRGFINNPETYVQTLPLHDDNIFTVLSEFKTAVSKG